MSAHGVLRDAALEPDLVQLVASPVDSHAGRVVVHTGENQIDTSRGETAMLNAVFKFVIVVNRAYVHVVTLNFDVWVDILQTFFCCLHFCQALVLRQVKHSVHVSKLHPVLVKK